MKTHREDLLVGAIEAGGTKFVCAVGTGPGNRLLARSEFSTGDTPLQVITEVTDWLSRQEQKFGKLQAIGIASFGPVDLAPDSPTYGYITSTPKTGWGHTNLLGGIKERFVGIPIGFDTDVNGAALGEHCWGSATGLSDFVYITIGTGIGAGGMSGGTLLHGLMHPEVGHILLPRVSGDDFAGVCPYHGACWEGLCSGPAMQARTGVSAEQLAADHPAWSLETTYIAYAIANITYILSPQKIILGGSVRKAGRLGKERFFQDIRKKTLEALNGYIVSPTLTEKGIDDYLVAPGLKDDAGVCGAIALGQCAVRME